MKNSHVRRAVPRKMNLVVGRSPKSIVARLQPFQPGERKPARRLQQIGNMLRAPGREFMFPACILSRSRRGNECEENPKQTQFVRETIRMHTANYIAVEARVQACSNHAVPKNTRRQYCNAS